MTCQSPDRPRALVYEALPQRAVFGWDIGPTAVADEVGRLGAERVMLIASRRQIDRSPGIASAVPVVRVHTDIAMHVPLDTATAATRVAHASGADALLCIGGGSATGLAKAIAVSTGLPIVAVPTTYAGSEATAVWAVTEGDRKTVARDPAALPRAIVYDASLTANLDRELTVSSGLNALAHGIDSLWAPGGSPISDALAFEAIRTIVEALRRLDSAPLDRGAREAMLAGTYASAAAFSSAGSGIHHKICHVLGGTFGLPHAQTHSVVLAHVMALNLPACPSLTRRLAQIMHDSDPASTVRAMSRGMDSPSSLAALGLAREDLPRAAELCLAAVPPGNPAPVTLETMRSLLESAYEGR